MKVVADAWKSTCNVEKHGKRQAPTHPLPKVTIQSLTMMMKHGHIGEIEIIDDQQADSTSAVGSAQGLMQHHRYGNTDHQSPTHMPVQMHCPYHIRGNYGS